MEILKEFVALDKEVRMVEEGEFGRIQYESDIEGEWLDWMTFHKTEPIWLLLKELLDVE